MTLNENTISLPIKIFTKEECNEIISYADRNGWYKAYYIHLYYKFSVIHESWVRNRLYSYLKTYLDIGVKVNVEMTVNRYLIGERNELHSDWTDIKNSRYNDRLITVNTILNDSFKGGDLIVGNTIIQQKTGHTFYHNSKILHEVTEVTDGERYTLVCFINNKDIITKKHLM